MSAFTTAFNELYACQTAEVGVAILATVTGYATSKPALLSGADNLDAYADGTTAEAGGFTLEMLISDFSSKPPHNTAVSCNGSATGFTLYVLDVQTINSATYRLKVGDPNA